MAEATQAVAEAQAEIKSAQRVIWRADNYRPTIGDDFQCPACWLKDERSSRLKQIGDPGAGIYQCEACHSEYSRGE
jgi:hypothetical protein